jgi:hypothetical protein
VESHRRSCARRLGRADRQHDRSPRADCARRWLARSRAWPRAHGVDRDWHPLADAVRTVRRSRAGSNQSELASGAIAERRRRVRLAAQLRQVARSSCAVFTNGAKTRSRPTAPPNSKSVTKTCRRFDSGGSNRDWGWSCRITPRCTLP